MLKKETLLDGTEQEIIEYYKKLDVNSKSTLDMLNKVIGAKSDKVSFSIEEQLNANTKNPFAIFYIELTSTTKEDINIALKSDWVLVRDSNGHIMCSNKTTEKKKLNENN